MSAEAVGYVFRHSPFTGATFAVHLAVADSVSDLNSNLFWMSQTKLAAKARCGRAAANKALKTLVEAGFIELEREGGGRSQTALYRFLFPQSEVQFESRHKTVASDDSIPGKVLQTVASASQTVASESKTVSRSDRHRTQENPREPKDFSPAMNGVVHHLPGLNRPAKEELPAEIQPVFDLLDELKAPEEFYDLDYWNRIDAAYAPVEGVFYFDELRKYLVWWWEQPPSKRRKAVKRSFSTWLKTEEVKARRQAQRDQERKMAYGKR